MSNTSELYKNDIWQRNSVRAFTLVCPVPCYVSDVLPLQAAGLGVIPNSARKASEKAAKQASN